MDMGESNKLICSHWIYAPNTMIAVAVWLKILFPRDVLYGHNTNRHWVSMSMIM